MAKEDETARDRFRQGQCGSLNDGEGGWVLLLNYEGGFGAKSWVVVIGKVKGKKEVIRGRRW